MRQPRGSQRVQARGRPRVLVIYKKSAYQLYVHERKHAYIADLVAKRHSSAVRLVPAHRDHMSTIEATRRILRDLGAYAVFRYRSDATIVQDFDLVVTLGGDGTLLWASHFVGPEVPIVAINTAPRDSVGYYCAGDRRSLRAILTKAIAGKLPRLKLTRMRVQLDDEVLSDRVLNDVLFCHHSPAATSRYLLRLGQRAVEQKSSGIWVGTAAGSTAAMRSAGGRVMPITSRRLQFVVREPYVGTGKPQRMTRGLVAPGATLGVISHMRAGYIFLDGNHRITQVPMGSQLSFSRSPEDLTILGFRGRKE